MSNGVRRDERPKRSPATFPDIPPTSMTMRRIREIMNGELRTDDDIEALLTDMFEQPEVGTYIFSAKGEVWNAPLRGAEEGARLRVVETQGYWYRHPNFDRNFVQVLTPRWDWQEDLKSKGEMLFRSEVALTDRERRRRANAETAEAMAAAAAPVPPQTILQRIDVHYRRHSSVYNILGLLLTIGGFLAAFAA